MGSMHSIETENQIEHLILCRFTFTLTHFLYDHVNMFDMLSQGNRPLRQLILDMRFGSGKFSVSLGFCHE